MLRRRRAEEFVTDITLFLHSEEGVFIYTSLSHPLWKLRNLVYAILELEKNNPAEEIELHTTGGELANYIDVFLTTFRKEFQLRNRKFTNYHSEK